MQAHRIPLASLILATLAVDVGLLIGASDSCEWPDPRVALILGLAGGQINLATLWGVLGSGHLPWRLATIIAVPIAWSFAIVVLAPQIISSYDSAAVWAVYFLTQTAMLASVLSLIRLFQAKLLRPGEASEPNCRRRSQFTLRWLFAWLTATAVALSLLKTTFEYSQVTGVYFEWDAILTLGSVNALLGLIAVWLLLDSRPTLKRLIMIIVTAIPIACVIAYTFTLIVGPDIFFAVILLWLTTFAYSALAAVVLRVSGYRLVWPKAATAAANPFNSIGAAEKQVTGNAVDQPVGKAE